ncbi:hypothetical protein VDG1235_2375 [Verrucomicrobiia bacterium DG1235]|nr:hypothetical protein VDG1235_2375 [Verrucomicrobiae bacterium DG1235]
MLMVANRILEKNPLGPDSNDRFRGILGGFAPKIESYSYLKHSPVL